MKKVVSLILVILLVHSTLFVFVPEVKAQFGSISGRVIDYTTSFGISGAIVLISLLSPEEPEWTEIASTITDENGYFMIPNLAPGYYYVTAYKEEPNYDPITWYVAVYADQVTSVNFKLSHLENFAFGASPLLQTIIQGESATYTISVTARMGYMAWFALDLDGLPLDVSYSFNPPEINPYDPSTSTLTITTTSTTLPGTYFITIIAIVKPPGTGCMTTGVTLIVSGAPPVAPKIEIVKYEVVNLYEVNKIDTYFSYIMKFPRWPIYSRIDVFVTGDEFVDHIKIKLTGVEPGTEIVRLTKIEPGYYAVTLLAPEEFSTADLLSVLYLVLKFIAAHYGFSLAPVPWYQQPTIPDVTLNEIIAVDIYGTEYHKTVEERILTYYDALALNVLLWDKGEIVLAACPVDLLVIDPNGNRVGSLYDEYGAFITEVNEVPDAFYTGRGIELEFIFIPHIPGDYIIEVISTETGEYTLTTLVFQDGQGSGQIISGRIVKGGIYVYIVSISATGAMTFNPDPAGTLGHLKVLLNRLPENVFKNNADQRKKSLCNKIDEVIAKIQAGEYQDAINKLMYDVRAKMDGNTTTEDWITDPVTQAELCIIIDHIMVDIQMINQ